MVSNSRRFNKSEMRRSERVEPVNSDIEFDPLEETYPNEEDSFSEMFHRLERDRSLGHDESYG